MPRARPAIAIDQRFMKVVATERRAEIVPAPPLPVEHRLPQEGMAVLPNELYASPVVKPIDCAQIVRETLKEMYFSVRWRVSEPGTAGAIATAPPGEADADLTAIAERNLAAGLPSSVLPKNPMKGEPDSKR